MIHSVLIWLCGIAVVYVGVRTASTEPVTELRHVVATAIIGGGSTTVAVGTIQLFLLWR